MRRNWPREGRQPVRDAGGFGPRPARGGGGQIRPNSERLNCVPHGAIYATFARNWRPSRGQFRAHKLRPSRGNFCDLRRIFADAKILVSDFCVRKNPSAYYALVRRSHITLKRNMR